MTLKSNSDDTLPSLGANGVVGLRCPACQASELVQAYVAAGLDLRWRKGARCLVCGERFPVSNREFAGLREPAFGEPNETYIDRYMYMLRTHMRALHVAVCLCALLVGLAVGGVMVARFDEPMLIVVFVPIMCFGWWLGRWLQPPMEVIPGKCPTCQYDLRGLKVTRCPECGHPFSASLPHGTLSDSHATGTKEG